MTADAWDQGPGLTSGLHDQMEITARLRECCFSCAPALVVLPDLDIVLQVRFADVSHEGLDVDLFSATGTIHVGAVCCVSFLDRGRSCVFITQVVGLRSTPPPDSPGLVLMLPQLLAWTEARQSFRVPVVPGVGLVVHVGLDDSRSLVADPLDLSFTGAALEFARNDDPGLPCAGHCSLELSLGGVRVKLEAIVERRFEHVYGLSFPGTRQGDVIRPPDGLRSIIRLLERRWIEQMKR